MNLIALDLPENVNDWPIWLERQVVGMHLRDLVVQLEVIAAERKPQAEPLSGDNWDQRLRQLLSSQFPEVLNAGLSTLNESQLRTLVRHPRLLLALQQYVLTEGGNYWTNEPRSDSHVDVANQIARRVTAAITHGPSTAQQPRSNRRWLMVVAAIAASIVLAVVVWRGSEPKGKFFARRGLLQHDLQGQAFLQELALAVQTDWQSPTNTDADFRQKLTALRDSCDVLLVADLRQLEPAVAADLRTRCRNWRSKLTGYLDALDSGKSLEEVQFEANATVDKLASAIRKLG